MDNAQDIPWATPPKDLVSGGEGYPAPLLDLPKPPQPLRVLGTISALDAPMVAVVGTRRASDEALSFAYGLSSDLAHQGVTVVSGGALGIDGVAHQGALDAGGKTVVVLASGLRTAYPSRHAPLFSQVLAAGGALLSEAPDDWAPRRGLFLRRNQLIAALGMATVVVEAPARSGAMTTARWAMSLKRRVFCVPGRPWDPRVAGCLALLRRGGEICTSVRDVLSIRPSKRLQDPPPGRYQKQRSSDSGGLGGDVDNLFRCLQRQPAHPDRIARELDIPVDRVQELLLSLELGGLLRRRIDGSYCAVSEAGADG